MWRLPSLYRLERKPRLGDRPTRPRHRHRPGIPRQPPHRRGLLAGRAPHPVHPLQRRRPGVRCQPEMFARALRLVALDPPSPRSAITWWYVDIVQDRDAANSWANSPRQLRRYARRPRQHAPRPPRQNPMVGSSPSMPPPSSSAAPSSSASSSSGHAHRLTPLAGRSRSSYGIPAR